MYTLILKEDDNVIYKAHSKYVARVLGIINVFISDKYQYKQRNKK